jgi:hypothetical protein
VAYSIGFFAFSGTRFSVELSVPVATSIGYYALSGTSISGELSLPAATSIGAYAFSGTNLTSVSLPASLTTISGSAFSGCTNLTSITVDSANTAFSARDGMLLNKAGTTLIAYPSATGSVTLTVTSIDGYAFYGTALTSVSLPAATSIGYAAFQSCSALESVNLPVATSIDSSMFRDCAALASVSLPAATSIGVYAFQSCSALESVSLPAATSIGSYAFYYCRALTSVSLPATPPSIESSIFIYTGYNAGSTSTITVTVPSGAVSAYTSAWSVDADTPAGGNTSVYGGAHKAVLITDAAQ